MRTPYTEQAHLEISRELGGGVAVSMGYLYVHGLKIGTVTGILNGVQTGTLPSGKPVFAGLDANGDGNALSDRPGNLGRNTLEGPGFASFDLRIARPIRVNERVSAEFSGDFFNLFNRVNVTDLNTVYGGVDFSVAPNPILGFNTPRDASNRFSFSTA